MRGLRAGRFDESDVELVVLLLEVVEVLPKAYGTVAVEHDETVVGLLLAVLVYETTAQGGHVLGVEGLDLGEDTGLDLVATILTVLRGVS